MTQHEANKIAAYTLKTLAEGISIMFSETHEMSIKSFLVLINGCTIEPELDEDGYLK